ncbi:hypothetical protein, partial [Prevotella sp.]|uniref:hypothetical protein n=2 Tax=Prevotella sp. TaxID=59823 RepID=UPI0040262A44
RSKLKNFAPKILLCAERGVLSVRNANIVFDGTAEELGVWNFEFGIVRQGALRSVILQMSLQYKPRRLWRPAVATHPRTVNQ